MKNTLLLLKRRRKIKKYIMRHERNPLLLLREEQKPTTETLTVHRRKTLRSCHLYRQACFQVQIIISRYLNTMTSRFRSCFADFCCDSGKWAYRTLLGTLSLKAMLVTIRVYVPFRGDFAVLFRFPVLQS